MIKIICIFLSVSIFLSIPCVAQQIGTASGKGTIDKFIPGDAEGKTEAIPFSPRHSFAYKEGSGDSQSTWIVLSEVEPPMKEIMSAQDKAGARQKWCEKEHASFVALKLDAKFAVDLYFLCPGNGQVNTEMLSTSNGLDSITVNFETKTEDNLKGKLVGGEGSCPETNENGNYCTKKSDYAFDTTIVR